MDFSQRLTGQGRRADLLPGLGAPRRHVLALGDSLTLLGLRRTGKTTLAKELLRTYRRLYPTVPLYILDSKRGGEFRGWRGAVWGNSAPNPLRFGTQIWQPTLTERDEVNEWLKRIYAARRPCIILIDELSTLAGEDRPSPTAQDFPRYYRIIQKLGAQLGITLLSLTQEAAYIPRETTGQMTHFFRFRLQNGLDAAKADRILGRRDSADGSGDGGGEPPDKHGFYYAHMAESPVRAWYYPDLDAWFG